MTFTSNRLLAGRRRTIAAARLALLGAAVIAAAPPARAGERCGGCDDGPGRQVAAVAGQPSSRDKDDSNDRRRRGDDNDRGDKDKKDKDDRDDDRRGRDGRYGYGGPFDLGWGGDGRNGDLRAPRPHEWTETQTFMHLHSPRRQEAIDQLPEGGKKESIKKFLFARYRTFQSLQRRDRGAYEQRLAQLKVEDQIFGLVSEWGAADEGQRQKLKERLRAETGKLVEFDLRERQRRVDELRQELDEQAASLESDKQDKDDLVEKRFGRFVDWANRWAARKGKQESEKKQASGDEPQEAPVPAQKSDKQD